MDGGKTDRERLVELLKSFGMTEDDFFDFDFMRHGRYYLMTDGSVVVGDIRCWWVFDEAGKFVRHESHP